MWQQTNQNVRQLSLMVKASCYAIVTAGKHWSVSDFTGELNVSGDAENEDLAQIIAENIVITFMLTKLLSLFSKERILGVFNAITQS